ncbi:MAG: mandelate racemase [Deltaproteobacteria bacterium]|jgi:L-alanine-DL-glutamate epimerase-like enolase superfamily enzyme|nr:mandelate racemase [Deltaproteobacteria bacterium]MBT4642450.1 mandelate racemase [Deltaproteobacteria bacterium]MBT6499025.1 mandelate racemase [Deltaproteobacteria bacterium]
MKITNLSVTLFAWNNIPMKSYDADVVMKTTASDLGLVRIETDQGIEGLGLLGLSMHPASLDAKHIIRFLKPILLGQDPLDRERLYQALSRTRHQVGTQAICAVDVALWDLLGKIAGMPVHRLLGTFREKIPVYASSEQHPQIEGYVEQALEVKAAGYHGYKLHPGQKWREDIAACKAVRKAVGDDFTLMLDSRAGYDIGEAVKVGRAIEEMGFMWYEDPMPYTDLYNYQKLVQKLDIPVMATEFPAGWLDQYAPWIMSRATDILRGDVLLKGGITTLFKIAHLAEAFSMKIEIHHGGNAVNDFANLHVQMAIPNTTYMEVLLPHEAWWYGLVEDIVIDQDGFAHAPSGPGLGCEIDQALVERTKIAYLD